MKLTISHIKKSFGQKTVLKDACYEFEEGKIYGLLGRNGSGKTTLFNVLNDDMSADGGKALLEDEGSTQTLTYQDIGYVPSTPIVPEFLTAREFLMFYIDINGKQDHKTVDEYFDMLNIEEEDRDRLLRDYSHGMKSKMQMLINFISKPKVLLLDEPLTSLDVVVGEEMKNILRQLKDQHIIIFSTHILDLALSLCDEIVLLNHGELSQVDMNVEKDEDLRQRIIQKLKDDQHE